jgi:serine/threonine-protein kinase
MNFEIGSTIGDYEVIGILGAGGMGKVYKVRNTISDRIEAMKVLLPDLATEPDLADRFLREIKVQASLEHPNIAALHTAVRVDNQLLMLMECVEGVTLEQKARGGAIPAAEAVDYIRQVLAALDYAHGRGVIHRDIKPANMMLTPEGVVKLMDFGIAKAATDRRLTMTGTTMGSLYYMSPEQIQGTAGLDARSDLYSMGVSLYELVTGKRPFDGDSQFAIMAAHLEKTPVPPVELDPKLPQMLNDVILMSVLKDPNSRFQTAAAFRNALGNVAGLAVQPPSLAAAAPAQAAVAAKAPPNVAAGVTSPGRSKRGLWMGVGAVAAVLAAIGVIEFGPGKGAKAAIDANTPAASTQPAAQTAPPQTAPPQTAPTETQPAASAPSQAQPAASVPTPNPAPSDPKQVRVDQKAAVRPPQSGVQAQPPTPAASQAGTSQPPPQLQVQQPTQQPAVQQPATPASAPAQSAEAAAVRAELMEVREQFTMLNVRANGIRGTLERLESQQAAAGHGLNAALAGPRDLMNSFMDETTNALNAGDPATARSMMKKAQLQVERLEKALNR